MIPIILESPFRGRGSNPISRFIDRFRNIRYARECMVDAFWHDEAPFASHLLYTQVLDDSEPCARQLGIEAGLSFYPLIRRAVFYCDRGITPGMELSLERARQNGYQIIYRYIKQPNRSR